MHQKMRIFHCLIKNVSIFKHFQFLFIGITYINYPQSIRKFYAVLSNKMKHLLTAALKISSLFAMKENHGCASRGTGSTYPLPLPKKFRGTTTPTPSNIESF